MSKQFVTYDANGVILGRYSVAWDDDADFYSSRIEVGDGITQEQFDSQPEIYMRVVAGALTAKASVTISADKTAITANGTDAATLTFTGLTATVTIRLAGADLTVTQADPELIITSDVPYRFVVKIFDDLHYSNTIEVIAA